MAEQKQEGKHKGGPSNGSLVYNGMNRPTDMSEQISDPEDDNRQAMSRKHEQSKNILQASLIRPSVGFENWG
jgi:hypothetical protein